MHYKNGRPAKNGDKVILMPSYGAPVVGILYDAQTGNDHCNGRIAPTSPMDPCPNLQEVLHVDDISGKPYCPPVDSDSPAQLDTAAAPAEIGAPAQ